MWWSHNQGQREILSGRIQFLNMIQKVGHMSLPQM